MSRSYEAIQKQLNNESKMTLNALKKRITASSSTVRGIKLTLYERLRRQGIRIETTDDIPYIVVEIQRGPKNRYYQNWRNVWDIDRTIICQFSIRFPLADYWRYMADPAYRTQVLIDNL